MIIWFYVFLLLLIFYYIFKIYNKLSNTSEKLEIKFKNLHGELYDDNAKDMIRIGNSMEKLSAIDHYRLGTVNLLNAKDAKKAHYHFNNALNSIIEQSKNGKNNSYFNSNEPSNNISTNDIHKNTFIIDKINDFNNYFVELTDLTELPIQEAILAHYDQQKEKAIVFNVKKTELLKENQDLPQKIILSNQTWESDSQNVHDSVLYNTLEKQYEIVSLENKKIKDIEKYDYNDVVKWIRYHFKSDLDKTNEINKVFNIIDKNDLIGLGNIREKDIIVAIWQRSQDPRNKENNLDIKKSLAESVLECIEGGMPVCMSGRTKKIWQSIALLDINPEIGVFKSKQIIRNEIYQKCAKIVDSYLGNAGSVSDNLKQAYYNDENTEQVNELKETIKKDIDLLIDSYANLLPKEIEIIKNECKNII